MTLNLGEEQPAIAILDNFKGKMMKQVFCCLEENNIHSVLVPANCTNRLQPLDLTVNRAIKSFLEREFQTWYAKQVVWQLEDGNAEPLPVDLSSVALHHIKAEWLYRAYEHISNNLHTCMVVNGFISDGISQKNGYCPVKLPSQCTRRWVWFHLRGRLTDEEAAFSDMPLELKHATRTKTELNPKP